MRTVLLLPLALLTAAAAGCVDAPDRTPQSAGRAPSRDLTLERAELPAAAVASPVELMRVPVRARVTHRPQRSRQPDSRAPASAGAPVPVAPVAISAAKEVEAADPHALAPGRTITVIPASSGPVSAPARTDEPSADDGGAPAIHAGGHGGRCDPREGGHPGTGWGGGFRGPR
jgi:hypothetical protein